MRTCGSRLAFLVPKLSFGTHLPAKLCFCLAPKARFITILGQRPRFQTCQRASAESALQSHSISGPSLTRCHDEIGALNRAFSACVRFGQNPGAVPQASPENAPLALNTEREEAPLAGMDSTLPHARDCRSGTTHSSWPAQSSRPDRK